MTTAVDISPEAVEAAAIVWDANGSTKPAALARALRSALTAREQQIREALDELSNVPIDDAERHIKEARDILAKGETNAKD
jgi:hypothetical protein